MSVKRIESAVERLQELSGVETYFIESRWSDWQPWFAECRKPVPSDLKFYLTNCLTEQPLDLTHELWTFKEFDRQYSMPSGEGMYEAIWKGLVPIGANENEFVYELKSGKIRTFSPLSYADDGGPLEGDETWDSLAAFLDDIVVAMNESLAVDVKERLEKSGGKKVATRLDMMFPLSDQDADLLVKALEPLVGIKQKSDVKKELHKLLGMTLWAPRFWQYRKAKSIFEMLLQSGANPNIKLKQINRYAGDYLLEKDYGGKQAHTLFALEMLLKYGADPEVKNRQKDTLMLAVARQGSIKPSRMKSIFELFIKYGANVNAISRGSVLDWLTWNEYADYKTTVAIVKKAGGKPAATLDPNGPDDQSGFTRLMKACANADLAKVKTEIKRGADPNVDNIFSSPMTLIAGRYDSAKPNYFKILKLLLESGGDPNCRPKRQKRTILDIIESNPKKDSKAITLLRKHGAKTKRETKTKKR